MNRYFLLVAAAVFVLTGGLANAFSSARADQWSSPTTALLGAAHLVGSANMGCGRRQ